jgi:2,4-dienoyl-CoA reductase-like NADH-dependent reductase (Old Yellow Enzyme family)
MRNDMTKLFEPIQVGNLTLANRIVIAPMCQ